MLNNLNPLGFVSREFSLIKEFILISLAIEYLTILVSYAMAILMFDLMPTIAALINRINAGPGQAPEPEIDCYCPVDIANKIAPSIVALIVHKIVAVWIVSC